MNLREIAHALNGEIANGQVLAPGPGHSKRDRSLAVRLSATSPDGFIVHSHSGDNWRDCQDYVRGRLGMPGQTHGRESSAPARRSRAAKSSAPDETRMRDAAQRLFVEAIDARGTLGERYLKVERRLGDCLDAFTRETIIFHPACPFRDGETLVRAPALVCAIRSAWAIMGACQKLGDPDAVALEILRDPALVVAVQRIRLDDKGRKIERRSLGSMGDDGVVFIGSPFESFYKASATIAEGVETALAMRALGHESCVALTGASRFRTFRPPLNWGRTVIAAENDDGASERAWRDAGERWSREDRRHVEVISPSDGSLKDANDVLMGARR